MAAHSAGLLLWKELFFDEMYSDGVTVGPRWQRLKHEWEYRMHSWCRPLAMQWGRFAVLVED